MKNADLFATFSSRLFPLLYDNFPIPLKLPKERLVDELESKIELWELKRKESTISGTVELLEITGQMTVEIRAKATQKRSELANQVHEKNQKLELEL